MRARNTVPLLLWAMVMGIVMTLPWSDFQGHAHWAKVEWIPFAGPAVNARDFVLNVLAFVPLGYLLAQRQGQTALVILVIAAAFSASGELYQVFSHQRFPSATDIVANVLGAYFGLTLCAARHRSWGARQRLPDGTEP